VSCLDPCCGVRFGGGEAGGLEHLDAYYILCHAGVLMLWTIYIYPRPLKVVALIPICSGWNVSDCVGRRSTVVVSGKIFAG
jgi:hypothetical protein